MIRAGEIAQQLAQDARGVAQWLLPQGRERNGEWVVGSTAGEAGESLKVRITGPKAGRWCDFGNQEQHGDLIDLWAEVHGLTIDEAIRQAADYLGIHRPQFSGGKQEQPRVKAPDAKPAAEDGAALEWLTKTRGISGDAVRAYRVASNGKAVVFPAFTPDGAIQYIKYRSTAEKKFWSERGGEPCLFGWQAIPDRDRHVVICEGECDALAWWDYGFPALSTTNGAGNLQWIDAEFDRLARFDQIFLAFDNDEHGREALPQIIERLGEDRCLVVELPEKDANDCLIQGYGSDAAVQAVANARSMDPEELVDASRFADDVIDEFWPQDNSDPGIRLPWKKAGDKIVLRPGEVSLIAGVNGHGKSEMAGQIALQAIAQDVRCCVASMEFKPAKWLRRLTRQAAAVAEPSADYVRTVHGWYRNRLWAFCATGTAKSDRILEVFRYAVRRYGIRFFVVDNLAKCGFDEDDYNSQKAFIDQLTDFARDFDCHVQVCVHMRKGESEDKPAGKMDIKGTGAITDMVDTVLVIWRNKKKEEERRVAEQTGEEFDESEKPDAVFKCVKQRNGEYEPTLLLWFCARSHQFVGKCGDRPFQYAPAPNDRRGEAVPI